MIRYIYLIEVYTGSINQDMSPYNSFSPIARVHGSFIQGIISAVGTFRSMVEEILLSHNIAEIQPDGWYLLQDCLDILKSIAQKTGDKTMFMIGNAAVKAAVTPASPGSIEEAILQQDQYYKMNHKGDGGGFTINSINSTSASMLVRTPYPIGLIMGAAHANLSRFAANLKITLDTANPKQPPEDDIYPFLITWEK